MHIKNKCIHCYTIIDTETYTCSSCKSEDVEEIYTVKCDNCGNKYEANIDDPCVKCNDGIYQEYDD